MFEVTLESTLITLGYVGIFGLMIANGIASFPSSQILYILTGFFISSGNLLLLPALFAGTIGNTIGNIILYELVRFRGIQYLTRFKIFPIEHIERFEHAFVRHGVWFVFVGKLLPAIKVFVPIAAGVGKMHRALYIPIIWVTSGIWALIFIGIGYFFGKNTHVFGVYGFILLLVALVVVGIFYKKIQQGEKTFFKHNSSAID